jgi:hypothetical protein
MVGAVYQFKYFYADCYTQNVEDDRYDTIIYKGTSPTIVIAHTFCIIEDEDIETKKVFYYVSNKTGSITLKNMFDAIDAKADEYKELYDTQKPITRLYIEDFIQVNPITFRLVIFADRPYSDSDTDSENEY